MANVAPEPSAVAPGTEGVPAQSAPTPSAGTQNTDQEPTGPGPIPYDRFKEVNDQLRPYKELETAGYDADSLRNLAIWEQNFRDDPLNQWLRVAENIEGMPEEVMMAIKDHLGEPYDTDDESDDEYEDEGTQADPLQNDRVRAAVEYAETRAAREADDRRIEVLNKIQSDWHALDQAQNVESPSERAMLTYIAGSAGTGNTPEEIMKNARDVWLEARGQGGSAVVKPGVPGLPPAVPGGAAPTGAERHRSKTFDEMNKLVKAAAEAGTL